MSHWNYRIIRHAGDTGLELCEVHYNDAGEPWGWTEAGFVADLDEGAESIQRALAMALSDAQRLPVLDVGEIKATPDFTDSEGGR